MTQAQFNESDLEQDETSAAAPSVGRALLPVVLPGLVCLVLVIITTVHFLPAVAAALIGLVAIAGGAAWTMRATERVQRQRIAQQEALEQAQQGNARHLMAEALGGAGSWSLERGVGADRTPSLTWSSGCFRLFGWPQEAGEPALRQFIEQIHPDDRKRWNEVHRRALRHGGEARIEFRFQPKDRSDIWVRSIVRAERSSSGQILRLSGLAQDITSVRSMQEQLAGSEAKFRELTQLSADWVWESDAEHRLSHLSESAIMVLGNWVNNFIGRPLWEPPPGLQGFGQPDWDRLRARLDLHSPIENFEYPMLDPSGQVRFVSINGRPIFDNAGAFQGYRGVGRNITREMEQRMLLRLESEVAVRMREHQEPERVVTAVLMALCAMMGWRGSVHLRRLPGQDICTIQERWGDASFQQMVRDLPDRLSVHASRTEREAWDGGKAQWVSDLGDQSLLDGHLGAHTPEVKAVLLAPILDEHGKVSSMLVCLSPAAIRSEPFFEQVAEILSRNLSLYLQRKAAERRLTHRSLHDALTDLPNRVFLTHQLETRLARQQRVAVLYLDLDRFKMINDTLGHSAGDQVLIEISQRLRDAIRVQDVPGRMGGDEFIVLLIDPAGREEVERIARRVLAAIEKPLVLQNRAYFLSASIGIAVAPEDSTDAAVLIKCADSAMYQVKSEGRNEVRFFTGAMTDQRTEQLQLAAELPLALERGEVDLHYQPILNVAERNLLGFEALLRWQHPVRGLLMPDRFLPAAEQTNLIREIGNWTLRRAIEDRAALQLAAFPEAVVSVNISARQFTEEGFLANLKSTLGERALPARQLQVELTESVFIEHPERTVALIRELREMGVRVIIDNFGTGYASLAYLKDLPVDGLKIDKVFVHSLPRDRGNAAIVQAIGTLCEQLGLEAVAEGVESTEELAALRTLGCDLMQGTLISQPLTFDDLADFLDDLPQVRQMHLAIEGDAVSV